MFITRRELKERIAELEAAVSSKKDVELINTFINDADLPKCESMACIGCEHIVFQNLRNHFFVIGCGKSCKCPDFQPTERTVENRQLLQEALLSQQEQR